MAFSFNEESAMEVQGNVGKKVLDTAVYDATILTVSETVASTGTKGVDISFKIDGAKYPNTVYGIWYEKSSGDVIGFNASKLNNFAGLLGGKVSTYEKEIDVRNGNKTVTAWKEADNFKCKIAVKKTFGFYGGVTEKNEIEAILSEEGKTYAEQVKKGDAKQLAYYTANLRDSYDKSYKQAEANGEISTEGSSEEESNSTESSGSIL